MKSKLKLSGRVGMVARFKPVHLGHSVILETVCSQADHFVIGLGSVNIYDQRNPFTADESRAMIDALLKPRFSNYSFVEVIDLFNGPRWRLQVLELFGELDYFITANKYVSRLMSADYALAHPLEIIPENARTPVTGTVVRLAMAQGSDWVGMVPESVAGYLIGNGLVERFRQEFGLMVLAQEVDDLIGNNGIQEPEERSSEATENGGLHE